MNVPTTLETLTNHEIADSKFFGPFGKAQGFSVEKNQLASAAHVKRAAVEVLLAEIRPSAVVWAVIIISVNTVKAHAIWAFSHIRKKILKVIPSRMDLYSNVIPALGMFAAYASAHALPRHVGAGRQLNPFAHFSTSSMTMFRCFHGMDYGMDSARCEY